ncbi:PSD1 and planctomycete cytochrome C domain-containing protein [Lignipirellula cremea]|uniref:Planctomycete cytochrome C n=1 Tax=Lignipirellula cremea TaxID=2528010 RepID=A0A518DSV7_9BACT|nr:PSD1 and planctomycete cytochrome C domain-containing protein [Lignipirellula cremea]QDU94922.1 Planctomycete cytochrome C [Lignipirellula cremea]
MLLSAFSTRLSRILSVQACFRRAASSGCLSLLVLACGLVSVPVVHGAGPGLPAAASQKVEFIRDIQPLLRRSCYSCHGVEEQEAGLRLDTKARALAGGEGGPVIIAGKSDKSRLVLLLAGIDEDSGVMPPEGDGAPFTSEEVALVRAWIDQGADWPAEADRPLAERHWSFQPIVRPEAPAVKQQGWIKNGIDPFILARLEAEGIEPAIEADRSTLIRRLYLDLLGLPPQPAEVEQFLSDKEDGAYERLVDRVLLSQHYGERWGRHWLDLARYADSDGYEKDRPRPHAWRYRDWVIAALNADMPFDQFTIAQVAGDLLPDADREMKTATGFHRNTLHNTEGGTDKEEDRSKKTVDRTNTTGAIWLGLTVGCAECHTHKYDPLTHHEYYSLYAFFNNIDELDLDMAPAAELARYQTDKAAFDAEQKKLDAAAAQYVKKELPAAQQAWEAAQANDLDNLLDQGDADGPTSDGKPADAKPADKKPAGNKGVVVPENVELALAVTAADRTELQRNVIRDYYLTIDPPLLALKKAAEAHKSKAPKAPTAKAQAVVERSTPREAYIHLRGNFLDHGAAVTAATPAWLPPLQPRGEQADRLDLARWIVSPENPLTARVTVNRIWQRYFGRGLAPNPDDLGAQGDPPSHPLLLDWLADEFRTDWSLKHVHRLIVTSAVYRQSSAARPELDDLDPLNTLLARQSRRRVEAEVIRDLALASSGLLAPQIGGPSVHPPQPQEYSTLTYAGSARWKDSEGSDRFRRGLYTFFQRTSPYPMLMTFDSPDSTVCTAQRATSNTPLQALTLWNDRVFFEAAQALGRRIVRKVPGVPKSGEKEAAAVADRRLEEAYLACFARRPNDAERSAWRDFRTAQLAVLADQPTVKELLGPEPTPEGCDPQELAFWVLASRTLMNLDEFVTKE